MSYYIGIDLGGTNIKAGVIDENWKIINRASIPTEANKGQDHVLSRMSAVARQVAREANLRDDQIEAVGVGVPGPVDPTGEIVIQAPNLGWKDAHVRASMEKELPWSVMVVNDANAAAYGEFLAGTGQAKKVSDLILITLGTGVGSGIVVDGELFIGPHGAGAELGHTIMTFGGRTCGCGQRGCLEQYASASAQGREAQKRIDSGVKTLLKPGADAKAIADAAAQGDVAAKEIVDEVCEYLGAACVNFVHAFDPQLILLGGGAGKGQTLLDGVRAAYKRHMWTAAPSYVTIDLATLGNDAGFIGSAGMARNRVRGGARR